MNTQTALTEASVAAEEQASDHEERIQALEFDRYEKKSKNKR